MTPVPPGYMTPKQVADRFGASVRWVYAQVERGALKPTLRRGYERGMCFSSWEVTRFANDEWRQL